MSGFIIRVFYLGSLDQVGATPLYPFCFVWAFGWAFFRWLRILQKTSFRSQSHHRSQLDYLIFACSNYHGKNFLHSSEEPASLLGPSIDLLGSACPLPLGVVRDSWAWDVDSPPSQLPGTRPAISLVELDSGGWLVEVEEDAASWRSYAILFALAIAPSLTSSVKSLEFLNHSIPSWQASASPVKIKDFISTMW